ncbi:SDR family oxidoreductase [Brumimicrobium glaciale]|uniref:dTDP-4-dehydrorhamnose reductase n=1 Tax=Brumimicrobium glaciale TaxID=200475 RepID=A0A4Q4KH11_9FLAO|nr:SDR family oxidoreductase [Brumimicrobium glaciale]RYM32395.1 SDR family oxidoreductase [Brumimicrobium glaciale]
MSKSTEKVLITGSNGLLGQKLVKYFQEHNIEFLATAPNENKLSFCPNKNFAILDITNMVKIEEVIQSFNPTHIINTAAMTNVDACEEQETECFNVNAIGVANIIEEIEGTDIHLIQISTDFIFDGKKKLYAEEDTPNPLSNYGKSKWRGEEVIFESGYNNFTILRTSIVYGVGEKLNKGNIFSWAINELRAGKDLNIVNDQFRTPTFVDDLVQACAKVVDSNEFGVYNIAGGELLSMHEYIVKVANYVGADVKKVHAITSEKLNQKAQRPISSGLDIDKAKTELDYIPTEFVLSLSKIDLDN